MNTVLIEDSDAHRECKRAFMGPHGDPLVTVPSPPAMATYPEDVAHMQLFMDAAELLRARWRGEMVMYLYDAASGDRQFRQQLLGCVLDDEAFCINR